MVEGSFGELAAHLGEQGQASRICSTSSYICTVCETFCGRLQYSAFQRAQQASKTEDACAVRAAANPPSPLHTCSVEGAMGAVLCSAATCSSGTSVGASAGAASGTAGAMAAAAQAGSAGAARRPAGGGAVGDGSMPWEESRARRRCTSDSSQATFSFCRSLQGRVGKRQHGSAGQFDAQQTDHMAGGKDARSMSVGALQSCHVHSTPLACCPTNWSVTCICCLPLQSLALSGQPLVTRPSEPPLCLMPSTIPT